MHVSIAPFNGLEIVSRSERTEVALGGDPTRTTVLEVRLRAVRPGRWQLGPARAVQGSDTVEAAALVVDVTANRAAAASALNPRLGSCWSAPAAAAGQAAVDLIVSADTVRVGEQVDVVTAAWFPRDLRLQLRRPPTLQPPVIDGVWSYPAGYSGRHRRHPQHRRALVRSVRRASDRVSAACRDGAIPRATLKYSTPVALQFFSQEERFALTSRADSLAVRPLPSEGRPADFTGAIGSTFSSTVGSRPASARAGEGVAVELSLTGEGNTALWPPAGVRWPAGGSRLRRQD